MHELGIIQNTLDLAMESAKSSGAGQIHALRLRVGTLTGLVPDALQFAFDVIRQGTIAAEARLDIETVVAICWCAGCQLEFASEDWRNECPRCHVLSSELRRGRELELVSLEVS